MSTETGQVARSCQGRIISLKEAADIIGTSYSTAVDTTASQSFRFRLREMGADIDAAMRSSPDCFAVASRRRSNPPSYEPGELPDCSTPQCEDALLQFSMLRRGLRIRVASRLGQIAGSSVDDAETR